MHLFKLIFASAIAFALSATARADLFVGSYTARSISQFTLGVNPGTIASSNTSFLTDLDYPVPIASSGSTLFVGNYGHDASGDTISEFTTSGVPLSSPFPTLPNAPCALAISGTTIYIATTDHVSNVTIGEYSISGALIKANFITGLAYPLAMAVSGSNLFVANQYTGDLGPGSISEYDSSSGDLVNGSLITGLNEPNGITISGNDLFVANGGDYDVPDGSIGEYTLGATRGTITSSTPALVPDLNGPLALAMSGSDLFVTLYFGGVIGEYSTSGASVNASLVTGLSDPSSIVVAAVPEPSLFAVAILIGGACSRIRRPLSRRRQAKA